MVEHHNGVDAYMESIRDYKEVLTDPNQFLSAADIRLGRGQTVKVIFLNNTNSRHKT